MDQLCIVFDLDDTLYLERDYVRSGFNAVGEWAAASLGLRDFSLRSWELFAAGHRGATFQEVLTGYGIEPDGAVIEEMVRVYRTHAPKIELLPDVRWWLSHRDSRTRVGLITDGIAACQQSKCCELNVAAHCDPIVYTGMWGAEYYKPHPRAFEKVEESVGRTGTRFVYVADNPAKDFYAPRRLGWDTVRVRRPGGLHYLREPKSTAYSAGAEIPDLWQLESVIPG